MVSIQVVVSKFALVTLVPSLAIVALLAGCLGEQPSPSESPTQAKPPKLLDGLGGQQHLIVTDVDDAVAQSRVLVRDEEP